MKQGKILKGKKVIAHRRVESQYGNSAPRDPVYGDIMKLGEHSESNSL